MPAPIYAQAEQAPIILPSDISDYRCLAALQDRQQAYLENDDIAQNAKRDVINNLIIISAFYAGRMTYYSPNDAAALFAQVRQELAASTPEQRDVTVEQCAHFYFSVMELLGEFHQASE